MMLRVHGGEMSRVHGGDVDAVAREYGVPVGALVDFSANINPLGPPSSVMRRLQREVADAALLTRYPDPAYAELRAALAAHVRVAQNCLTIGNGSAAVLSAVVHALVPRRCLLPTPAFSEQIHALEASGCAVRRFPLEWSRGFRMDVHALCAAIGSTRPDVCIITNPHNPSGALISRSDLLRITEAARNADCHLVIDEAFIDYAVEATLTADACHLDRLVVLRSLTKFYGMPALRVGYAVATPSNTSRIAAHLPAWPVTTLAAASAAEAVKDEEHARRTMSVVAADREHLRERLAGTGMECVASAANFLLLRLPPGAMDSTRIRATLIRHHRLIVRDCRSFDGMEDGRFIRVAVRTRAENERLVEAINCVLQDTTHVAQ